MGLTIRKLLRLFDVNADSIADGETIVWDAAAGEFVPGAGGGGGAPTDATYLVTAANAGLSAEVAVGATPGGELGGTWASPTVDASHSGSTHAAVQAAAEAAAAAALASHAGAADPHPGYRLESVAIVSADIQDGTIAVGDLSFDPATQAELDAHLNDTADAHDASSISILDTAADFTATDVEGALAELQADAEADATALSDHIADTSAAHAGTAISNTPAGAIAATTVQAAINELDSEKAALSHAHAGEDITSGTVADARIAATIARDSEVTAAVSASEAGQVRDGDAAGGVLAGTYPSPSFASDMATQAELDAHESDTTSVHGIADTSALYRVGGTDVAVADGGTGSSTAAGARTNLGIVSGLSHMPSILNTIWSGDTHRIGNGYTARTQNLLQAFPTPLRAGTLALIAIRVETSQASNTFRLGIYNDNGGYPGTLLVDAGTVDASTTGVVKSLSISNTITDGIYWLCCVEQGGAAGATILTSTVSGKFVGFYLNNTGDLYVQNLGFQYPSVSGALPANWTSTVAGVTTSIPSIFVRYA